MIEAVDITASPEIPDRQFTNLTVKQEKFVQSYLINGSASLSATNAGYPAKTAASMGWQLLKNPKILKALDSLRTKVRANITKESFVDKAMARFERLPDTEPNSPRFLDIAGKALGYIGAVNQSSITNNTQINIKADILSMPLAIKWDALRSLMENT